VSLRAASLRTADDDGSDSIEPQGCPRQAAALSQRARAASFIDARAASAESSRPARAVRILERDLRLDEGEHPIALQGSDAVAIPAGPPGWTEPFEGP
jgi:hypothetical protein